MLLKKLGQVNRLLARYKHQNHPGHKLPPPAYKPRLFLPDNYLEEANYPPVKPRLPPGEWPQDYDPVRAWKYWEEGEKFTRLKTIQERLSVLAYLNVQQTLDDLKQRKTRYYPIFMLSALPKAARMSPFVNFITKTHVETVKSLPSSSPSVETQERDKSSNQEEINLNKSVDFDLYEKLKHLAKETILINFNLASELPENHSAPEDPQAYKPESLEIEKRNQRIEEDSNRLIQKLFSSISSVLATRPENNHLQEAQYGEDVNIRAYWKRCGFEEVTPRGATHQDPDVIRFQFDDKASFQIKSNMPLKPLYDFKEAASLNVTVPDYAFTPANFRVFADHILPMQTPGHWFGDPREFNYLTVFNTSKTMNYAKTRLPDYEDHLEMLKSMAVMCAHAELTAQAYYLGFSMWKDLTYPLFGQFIFTNGQDYAFMNYQLNTIRLWNNGPKISNLAYLTIPERLFELNNERTQVTQFNDQLFRKIINFVTERQPVRDASELVSRYSELDHMIGGTRLRPYLSVQDMNTQLTKRHQLLATSLYELVKYDRPMDYLLYRSPNIPHTQKPKFHRFYDKCTYDYRDIVWDYYPRDFYGFKLVERMLRKAPRQTLRFWDLKTPVYEWANIPPPDTNNIPRNIDLPTF